MYSRLPQDLDLIFSNTYSQLLQFMKKIKFHLIRNDNYYGQCPSHHKIYLHTTVCCYNLNSIAIKSVYYILIIYMYIHSDPALHGKRVYSKRNHNKPVYLLKVLKLNTCQAASGV